MNIELLTTGGSLVIAAGALVIALRAWQRSSATFAREDVFAARAKLFDAALAAGALEDEAYRDAEHRLNGLLRWLDEINGLYVIYVLINLNWGHMELPQTVDHHTSPITDEILRCDQVARVALRRHLWMGTPSGFCLMGIAWATGQFNRLFNVMTRYSRQMANDDFARREHDNWSHGIRPAC